MSRPDIHPWRRRLAAALAVVAVIGAYGLTLERLLATVGTDIRFGSAERDGAAYLRPLVQLLAATADAQSAAVTGRTPDGTRLTETRAAVAAADARYGADLATTTRWTDLEARLDRLADTGPTGAEGYARWSEVVDLELALVAAVGDSSNLILDPQLDVYYVMDSVLLRLPTLVVSAGRVSDLNRLSAGASRDRTADAAAVERTALGALAAGVDTGLRKSFGTTRSRTLGPALLGRLDRLRDATSRIAPPAAALGASVATPSAQDDEAARRQVRDAALALEAAAIDELDALLATRVDGLRTQRALVLGAGAAAAGVLALAGWLLLPRRRTVLDEDDDEPVVPDAVEDPDLVEARDLLEARQLVRSGRAIATSRDTR